MILLPAIDLYEGKVVRLTQGDYGNMTVYREDPAAQAAEFQAAGAVWLHTVDLEGARDGGTPNFEVIRQICRTTGLKVEAAVRRFGAHVAVGVDLKEGAIAIRGWKETAPEPAEQFFARLCALGVRTVICTDVSRDGMLGGTNVALYRALSQQFDLDLIASGGVSSIEDLQRLKETGLYVAILGKALYTRALELRRALREVE